MNKGPDQIFCPIEEALPNAIPVGEEQGRDVNYRDQFKAFLRKERFSEYGAERFMDLLTSFVDPYIAIVANPSHRTVFEVSDVDTLTMYHKVLMGDVPFVTKDRSKGRQLGRALLEYIEFAKMLPSIERLVLQEKQSEETPDSHTEKTAPDEVLIKATVTLQNKRQELIRQAQTILQPIEEYLHESQIASVISFEYNGAFPDVDVLSPRFKKDLNTEADELCQMVSLMKKYGVTIPISIRERLELAKEMKALKDTIRSFENWLIGYLVYLPLKSLAVDSINYSPKAGFKIALSGKGINPSVVTMRTSVIGSNQSKAIKKPFK